MSKSIAVLMLIFCTQIAFCQHIYTTENSSLPINKVLSVYIDSTNNKWFGTTHGLACLSNSGNWSIYSDSTYLKNNVIRNIDFEHSEYGSELWLATDSGLTVAAYNQVDGITSATTYTPDNSGILDYKTSNVLVDKNQNRWVASLSGVSVFVKSNWFTETSNTNPDGESFNYTDYPISGLELYEPDSLIHIATKGQGIMRSKYQDVDGITGASTYGKPWAGINTNEIDAMTMHGNEQWYATSYGAYLHLSNQTKDRWYLHSTDSGLIDNTIKTMHIDKRGNTWFACAGGLSIATNNGWYQYTEPDGLLSKTVNCITSDADSNVWLGTNKGVQWFPSIPGELFVSVFNNESNEFKLNIYPNPAIDIVNLNFGKNYKGWVQIISSTGVLLKTIQIKNEQLKQIDLNNFKQGYYLVKANGIINVLLVQ